MKRLVSTMLLILVAGRVQERMRCSGAKLCPCQSRPGDLEEMSFMRMVWTSMKGRPVFFRTSKACSPQVEYEPWFVHKEHFARMNRLSFPNGSSAELVLISSNWNPVARECQCCSICLFVFGGVPHQLSTVLHSAS